jgi:hypothetical protein
LSGLWSPLRGILSGSLSSVPILHHQGDILLILTGINHPLNDGF